MINTTAHGSAHGLRTRLLASMISSKSLANLSATPHIRAVIARRSFPSVVAANRLKAARRTLASSDPRARRNFSLKEVRDVCCELDAIRVPVTVLVGTRDPVTPLAEAVDIAESISESRLRTLAGAGHLLPIERPAEVAHEIELASKIATTRGDSSLVVAASPLRTTAQFSSVEDEDEGGGDRAG